MSSRPWLGTGQGPGNRRKDSNSALTVNGDISNSTVSRLQPSKWSQKAPSTWGDRPLTGLPLSLNKAPSIRIGLHLTRCWPKGSHGNPTTTQAVGNAVGCSPQTEDKALLWMTTSTQLVGRGETELVPAQFSLLHSSVFRTGRCSVCCFQVRNINST